MYHSPSNWKTAWMVRMIQEYRRDGQVARPGLSHTATLARKRLFQHSDAADESVGHQAGFDFHRRLFQQLGQLVFRQARLI